MPRYFIEVAYKGTAYSGFQVQDNAETIQSVLEKALQIFTKQSIALTGSSRTDAGVHALQNFFHFDLEQPLLTQQHVYNLNAILPADIAIIRIAEVKPDAHSRFNATYRAYKYFIYQQKSPFLQEAAWYYPFKLDIEAMQQAAAILLTHQDFTSFSKKHTQVNNFNCQLSKSIWVQEGHCWVYHVQGNRFLRGMVKGLVGTMLRVGRGQMSLEKFEAVIAAKDCSKADFTPPSHGLFLAQVHFSDEIFLPDKKNS